jgi:hypothetical protein
MIEAMACGILVVALTGVQYRKWLPTAAAGYERIYRTVHEIGGLAFKRRATG